MPINAADIPPTPVALPLDAKTQVAASKPYPVGKTDVGIFVLPVDAVETTVSISRAGLPDTGAPVIAIRKFFSDDNGLTWIPGGASYHFGGVWAHRDGKIRAESTLTTHDLGDVKNPNRQLKVILEPMVDGCTPSVSVQAKSVSTLPDVIKAVG
jgi:hypothetical protein